MRVTLLALLALLALNVGCAEVESCQRGAPGCLAGPPKAGACELGLVLINGACAEPGAGAAALSCQCPEGQICTLDAYQCVDYCEPIDVEIGTAPPRAVWGCSAIELSFDQLCENRCLNRCRRWQELCPSSAGCTAEACKGASEKASCRAECGASASPERCMAQACNDVLSQGCKELACPEQKPAKCDDVQCRNSCPLFNFDGMCDDGDMASAVSGACAYGSDCADCGPRHGATPKPAAQGKACAFHSGCAGAKPADLADSEAWCIQIAPDVSRCAPDCSSPDEVCPEGSSCFSLSGVDQDGDGALDPVEQDGLTASACFPAAMCQ
jgi:hypothetical protein